MCSYWWPPLTYQTLTEPNSPSPATSLSTGPVTIYAQMTDLPIASAGFAGAGQEFGKL
jgi:hypothetical protein